MALECFLLRFCHENGLHLSCCVLMNTLFLPFTLWVPHTSIPSQVAMANQVKNTHCKIAGKCLLCQRPSSQPMHQCINQLTFPQTNNRYNIAIFAQGSNFYSHFFFPELDPDASCPRWGRHRMERTQTDLEEAAEDFPSSNCHIIEQHAC